MKRCSPFVVFCVFVLTLSSGAGVSARDEKTRVVYKVTKHFTLVPSVRLYTLQFKHPLPRVSMPGQTVSELHTQPRYNAVISDPAKNEIAVFYFSDVASGQHIDITMSYLAERALIPFQLDPEAIPDDYPPLDASFHEYLSPEENISLYADQVQGVLASIIGDLKNPYQKGKAIYDFIVKNIAYENIEHQSGLQRCLETLTNKKGNCADITKLYITFARASGIPARQVDGVVFMPDVPATKSVDKVGHAWVEIYLPVYGWLPVDPTFGIGRRGNFYCFNYTIHIPESYGQVVSRRPGSLYKGSYVEFRSYTQTNGVPVDIVTSIETELIEGKPFEVKDGHKKE
jgi:transglutaminase-like putative cysteine protease